MLGCVNELCLEVPLLQVLLNEFFYHIKSDRPFWAVIISPAIQNYVVPTYCFYDSWPYEWEWWSWAEGRNVSIHRELTVPSLLCFLPLQQTLHFNKKIQCNTFLCNDLSEDIIVAFNILICDNWTVSFLILKYVLNDF